MRFCREQREQTPVRAVRADLGWFSKACEGRKEKQEKEKGSYEYEYSRSGVEITGKPETAEERLREILIRKLNLDVQVDAYAFACFICAFTDIGSFDSMPWEERAELMKYKYGVDVSDRTLRNWCRKLISSNIIQKCGK